MNTDKHRYMQRRFEISDFRFEMESEAGPRKAAEAPYPPFDG
jgi:hypothetical protein